MSIYFKVGKNTNEALLFNLEQCTKYEITITPYLGLKQHPNGPDKDPGKADNMPIFKGENSASLIAHTTVDASLPLKLDSLRIMENANSIVMQWSNNEWPCIEMDSMMSVNICEMQKISDDEISCSNKGVIKQLETEQGVLRTTFDGLTSCQTYLVSRKESALLLPFKLSLVQPFSLNANGTTFIAEKCYGQSIMIRIPLNNFPIKLITFFCSR